MAGCCVTYLFFSYLSSTIIFFILAIFANTDNVALLIEHYKFEDGDKLKNEEQKKVKERTYLQYYLGSSISLVLSILLYFFCMREKKVGTKLEKTIALDIKNKPYQPIILNAPENNIMNRNNDFNPNNNSDDEIRASINSFDIKSDKGMGENEI